jgi:hypothetical protein
VAPHFGNISGFSKNRVILSVGYKITSQFGVEEKGKGKKRDRLGRG